jgi:cell division protein FtsL
MNMEPRSRKPASRLLNGPARVAIMSLVLVAILFLFVFPTRSFLAQRHQIGAAQHDLDVLQAQNRKLENEAALLKTPAEIERIARTEYGMTRPGEQAYAVVPAPTPSTTTTTTSP